MAAGVSGGPSWVLSSGCFSADADGERLLTTSDDDTASLWNAVTGALQTVLHGHDGPINAAVFSPDGSLVATASDDGTARIWSWKAAVRSCAFRMKARSNRWRSLRTATGADSILGQNSARLERRRWRAACSPPRSRGINRPLNGIDYQFGGPGVMRGAAISPNGTRAVILYAAGWIGRVWTVFPSTQALVDSARSRMPRPLTAAQRKQFFLD